MYQVSNTDEDRQIHIIMTEEIKRSKFQ